MGRLMRLLGLEENKEIRLAVVGASEASQGTEYEFMLPPFGDARIAHYILNSLQAAGFDFQTIGGLRPVFRTMKESVKAELHLYGSSGGSPIGDRFRANLERLGLVNEDGTRDEKRIQSYLAS